MGKKCQKWEWDKYFVFMTSPNITYFLGLRKVKKVFKHLVRAIFCVFNQRPHVIFSPDQFTVNNICVQRCVQSERSTQHAYFSNRRKILAVSTQLKQLLSLMHISIIQTTWREQRREQNCPARLALLSWKLSTFLLKMLLYTARTVNWNYHWIVQQPRSRRRIIFVESVALRNRLD